MSSKFCSLWCSSSKSPMLSNHSSAISLLSFVLWSDKNGRKELQGYSTGCSQNWCFTGFICITVCHRFYKNWIKFYEVQIIIFMEEYILAVNTPVVNVVEFSMLQLFHGFKFYIKVGNSIYRIQFEEIFFRIPRRFSRWKSGTKVWVRRNIKVLRKREKPERLWSGTNLKASRASGFFKH